MVLEANNLWEPVLSCCLTACSCPKPTTAWGWGQGDPSKGEWGS